MTLKNLVFSLLIFSAPLSAFAFDHPFKKYVGKVYQIASTYCEVEGKVEKELWHYDTLEFVEKNTYLNPAYFELGLYRTLGASGSHDELLLRLPDQVFATETSTTLIYGTPSISYLEEKIEEVDGGLIYTESQTSNNNLFRVCRYTIKL